MKDRIKRIYSGMKQRCYNKNCDNYRNYGGRGISICQEWLDDYESFEKWALSNGYSDELSIDRINNNGNYCPENCRWADAKTQCENKRDPHQCWDGIKRYEYNGEWWTLQDLVYELGVDSGEVRRELEKREKDLTQILEEKVREKILEGK